MDLHERTRGDKNFFFNFIGEKKKLRHTILFFSVMVGRYHSFDFEQLIVISARRKNDYQISKPHLFGHYFRIEKIRSSFIAGQSILIILRLLIHFSYALLVLFLRKREGEETYMISTTPNIFTSTDSTYSPCILEPAHL